LLSGLCRQHDAGAVYVFTAVASKPLKYYGFYSAFSPMKIGMISLLSPSYMICCKMLAQLCNRNDKLQLIF
jgi:hypothetical protein